MLISLVALLFGMDSPSLASQPAHGPRPERTPTGPNIRTARQPQFQTKRRMRKLPPAMKLPAEERPGFTGLRQLPIVSWLDSGIRTRYTQLKRLLLYR